MATLTLDRVWLTLVSSGESVAAYSDDGRTRLYEDEGEVRTYGEGRQRAVSSEGERGRVTFTLVDVTEDQLTTLRGWKKQLVQARDHRGRRYFGVYFGVAVTEPKMLQPSGYTAEIELSFLTYVEGS
jgi:hypothetical protein